MLLPIDWLREFVDTKGTIEDIAEVYYNLGFGVDNIDKDKMIIDLEITPNRGDALSILGLAREYAAFENLILKKKYSQLKKIDLSCGIKIKNETEDLLNYSCAVINEVDVRESPQIIKDRLHSVNIKSINNIIDITNYLMVENGHPLHVFDIDKISGEEMVIKYSKKNDLIKTLDENKYILPEKSLIARDANGIIDLVGIQGGFSSGITSSTKNILIQAINVSPKIIRKTSKIIGHSTEASYRFERGVDPLFAQDALQDALNLIQKLAGGKIIKIFPRIDNLKEYKPTIIYYDYSLLERKIGVNIEKSLQIGILRNLGFTVDNSKITVPSFRANDVKYPIDIVEEVIRIYGYSKIKKKPLPIKKYLPVKTHKKWLYRQKIVKSLLGNGFSQINTYSFLSDQMSKQFNKQELVKIINPLSSENKYLRPSLIPLMIDAAEKNTWANQVNLFEIGNIFTQKYERTNIAIISTKPIELLNNIKVINKGEKPYLTRKKYYTWEGELDKFTPFKINSDIIDIKVEKYKNISKYPPVVRDLAILIDKKYQLDEIKHNIENINYVLVAELFDVFNSDKFDYSIHSVAFRIVIDDEKKTLNAKKADEVIHQISELLKNKYKAIIR